MCTLILYVKWIVDYDFNNGFFSRKRINHYLFVLERFRGTLSIINLLIIFHLENVSVRINCSFVFIWTRCRTIIANTNTTVNILKTNGVQRYSELFFSVTLRTWPVQNRFDDSGDSLKDFIWTTNTFRT